jgi:hypothetical protein
MTIKPQEITLTFKIKRTSGPKISDPDVIREALEDEVRGLEFYAQDPDKDEESGFEVDDVVMA